MAIVTTPQEPIAYFCAEFGLKKELPLYAGGLGILAGDTLRAAAEAGVHMVGVGLLYRGESAVQLISADGQQTEADQPFDPLSAGIEHVYLDDKPLFVKVHLTEVDIWLRCWKETISPTVTLYLLDTETDQNHLNERAITHALYKGSDELEVKQQMLLGIGGVKLLSALGIHPQVFHLNEGRPAFLHWQLIRQSMSDHGMSYPDARQHAIARTVYTNHTLVAAGNKTYARSLIETYASYYAQRMGVSLKQLLQDGTETGTDGFNVTRFALNTSRKASGVSKLHTDLSRQNWPEYNWVNVTNGVALNFWQRSEISAARNDAQFLWQVHQQQKQALNTVTVARTGYSFDPNRLVIGWARRLAGYKRFDALFADVERLKALVSNSERPVQILLAGKAHYLDSGAKQRLKELIQLFQTELAGYALFIPNYDIEVAQAMVAGVDLWLNTPEFGKEASGTSGMKAIANGVLQATVTDGWAHEVDWSGIGWTLDSANISQSLYSVLEDQIVPLFYSRDESGLPLGWIQRMKLSIETAPRFSAARMIQEYQNLLYAR